MHAKNPVCAASQGRVFRGNGFARHLHTNVSERTGHRQADAVYTVSQARLAGAKINDAEVVVAPLRAERNTDGVRTYG